MPPLSPSIVLIDGRPALRIEASEIGRTVHIYVPDNSDVIEISYDLNNPIFVVDYETMLSTLKIGPSAPSSATQLTAASGITAASSTDAVDVALQQVGKPYQYGAEGPAKFDCSGLTEYSYAQVGIKLPHMAAAQALLGSPVTGPLQRGDLVFFETDTTNPGVISHVGIILSGTIMIDAPHKNTVVRTDDISQPIWRTQFRGARRISAVLTNLTPNSGPPGAQNLAVSITGQNTHFVQGTTVASFGAGITIVSLTVTSDIAATAVLNIDQAATAGVRTVTMTTTMTTGSEVASLSNGFTVTGQVPAVLLNPFGDQTGPGPYNVEVVNSQLSPEAAPAAITVTLFRQVISQCSNGFMSDRTVVVSQRQSSAAFNFNAGRDPGCSDKPITTRYTVTSAVMAPGITLDLSAVPSQQLILSVTR